MNMFINKHLNIKDSSHMNDVRFIRMNGEIIDGVSNLKYLGTYFNENLLNKDHLEDRYKMVAVQYGN
jgi:hypothetical protein